MSVWTASQSTGTSGDPAPIVPMPPLPAPWKSLGRAFLATARLRGGATALVDSTGASLSYRQALMRSLALARVLDRLLGPSPHVGIFVPPSVGGAVTNIALTMLGKVPVNLNYSASQEALDSSVSQAELTHVLASSRLLEKVEVRPNCELILLEDLAKQVRPADKAWAFGVSTLVPTAAMGGLLPGLRQEDLEAPATIVFTSGSTGTPKGVVLTHRNILSNVQQIRTHVELSPGDVVLGILPFFHSFGFTVPLWTVLGVGLKAVYHPNPLDARVIGRLCREHQATVLLATPTFVRGYLKKCNREDFATLRLLIVGAEKLKPELAEQIRSAWEIEPLEGYGCTETGPVVSVNTPGQWRTPDGRTVPGNRPGTIGTPMPGTMVKAVDPETGEDVSTGHEGVICVKGPQVMSGYLNRPEATAEVLKDGWYWTGDIGLVDPDGFIAITDRLNRFSKIGGEMVPHAAVESAILKAAGTDEHAAAVTSLPDPKRGERLIVLHTPALGLSPEEVVRRLNSQGMVPKLWIPSTDAFVLIDEVPVLGSGKLDLRRLRQIARDRLER